MICSTSTWFGISRCQVKVARHKTFKAYPPRSRKVEAIEVHHLVPGRYKIMDKLLLRVRACIDFSQGTELGVRTEDEIDTGAGPLEFADFAIVPFKHVLGVRDRLP